MGLDISTIRIWHERISNVIVFFLTRRMISSFATLTRRSPRRHPTFQGPDVAPDVFALGTTPYSKVNSATGDVQRLYMAGELFSLEHLMLVIKKCWRGSCENITDVAFDLWQVQ